MEAVGIGDLHLTDSNRRGGLSEYIGKPDAYVCSEAHKVCDYAESHNIPNVFLYGDLCDQARMSYEGQLALSALYRKHPDLTFYVIPGNHDLYGRTPELGHSLELLSEFNKSSHVKYLFQPTNVTIDGAPVRFLPFPHGRCSPKALNVCHIDVYGAVSDSGRQILNEERDRSDNLIVSGHIHTNQVVRNTYYSGTLYQTCFGEKLPKFFHHIQFDSVSDFEITSVPFKPRYRLHTLTVASPADIPKAGVLDPKYDLVKLVIQDGTVITPEHYAHLNVVRFRQFQSKQQLAKVLQEDMPTNSKELRLSTKDFFNVWVSGSDAPDELKSAACTLRRKILSSVR